MSVADKKPISRREALKAIAAVTGVAVLSSVRNEWKTPLVQVGVLPAHAQASRMANLRVNNFTGGSINVTVPFVTTLTSLETQEISNGGSGTFTLAPGSYTAHAQSIDGCLEGETFSFTLAAGETVVWDVYCPD